MTAEDYEAAGYQTLKQWVMEKAEECNVGVFAIYMRLHRNRYPNLKYHRVNKRVIFVEEIEQ